MTPWALKLFLFKLKTLFLWFWRKDCGASAGWKWLPGPHVAPGPQFVVVFCLYAKVPSVIRTLAVTLVSAQSDCISAGPPRTTVTFRLVLEHTDLRSPKLAHDKQLRSFLGSRRGAEC